MAMATATASSISMESSQTMIQSESHVSRTYTESSQVSSQSEHRSLKKKKSSRRHKDDGTGPVSVSRSSSKLHKKMKQASEVDANPQCQKCQRPVYAMERIKAEKRIWHKDCFRCVQCNKQLTVETYESDHTTLYCKNHFKQLFEPKPVGDDDQTDAAPLKKHQMIICESSPVELPPDVVRASDKPDLGLEELSHLDVKSRFEVFENKSRGTSEPLPAEPKVPREKSTALLSKLAKFKAKGMDVGVSDEYLNGVPLEPSSSEPEDEDADDEDSVLRKSYKHTQQKEQPISFCNMSEIVGRFEAGQDETAERHRTRKQEIQNIRSRLFMGKQAKIKEMYEQSVMQSEQGVTSAEKIAKDLELDSDKSRAIKQRFETGELFNDENQPPKNREIDDRALFNEGIGKKSRSIFLELDANSKNCGPLSPPQEAPKRKELQFVPKDVVRAADKQEDVHIETADISDRFKFFETYKEDTPRKQFRMTPPRQVQRAKSPSPEVYHDPSIVRGEDPVADTNLAQQQHTASRMINVFRQMEENSHRGEENQGPKPLKCFTPPPPGAYTQDSSSEEEYTSEEEDSEEERRREYMHARERDEALKQAQQLARTKSFRDRFENWSESEPQRSPSTVVIDRGDDEEGDSQLDTAKSLREKFEAMKVQGSTVTKAFVPKVNRFVRAKSPSPEVYHDPSIVRGEDPVADTNLAQQRHTASRMINVFRQMEENSHRGEENQGPKPLKCFTPPPPGAYTQDSSSEEEYTSEEEDSEEERRREYMHARERDEALKQAQQLARTKSFRDRFENWSESEPQRSPSTVVIDRGDDEEGDSQLDTAKSLREKFEAMKVQGSTVTKAFVPKVNRFVRAKSPSPEVYHDPSIVRGEDPVADTNLAQQRHTASRMINVFRQMEENSHRGEENQGPKPLKCFTPPPPGAYTQDSSSEEEYTSEEEDSEEERRREYMHARERDEALKQAQQLARTKSFRDRFENWSESEPQRSPSTVVIDRGDDEEGDSQLDTAKSLREKFEAMKVQGSTVTKAFVPKVNRFV